MNGAERLLETLVGSGIEVCFANPGTSEMQLVSAIGNSKEMRAVLCLFEGVVAGAADGYARMSDKPALTLLHLGAGFSNSMANQHNAHRAHVPLVNIVGDHATYHLQYDSPLTSDVPAHARISSDWTRVSESADDLAASGAGQPTAKTLSMFDLSRPDTNWINIAQGMGVPATRAMSAEEFHQQFANAMTIRGPQLIEAMVIQQMS